MSVTRYGFPTFPAVVGWYLPCCVECMDQPIATRGTLCYLPARALQIPGVGGQELDVSSLDDRKLGRLDGVLIDPAARRLRYFVVESHSWLRKNRFVVAADQPVHVDSGAHKLRVEADARDVRRERFDRDSVRAFSDEDLMTSLFGSRAA